MGFIFLFLKSYINTSILSYFVLIISPLWDLSFLAHWVLDQDFILRMVIENLNRLFFIMI